MLGEKFKGKSTVLGARGGMGKKLMCQKRVSSVFSTVGDAIHGNKNEYLYVQHSQ